MLKVGDLVKFVRSPSSTFKWEKYVATKVHPGVIMREIDEQGTTTRRFEIRWHDGEITREWISYLECFTSD